MRAISPLITALLALAPVAAVAAEPAATAVTLTLRDHRFIPDTVSVPAGAPIVVTLINQDAAAEEFDSSDLKTEQDVTPKARIVFRLKPLAPGTYRFMGEAHPETAQGALVAVAASR